MTEAATNRGPSDPNTTRHIRVFISSTFRDMQDERDILIKKIFPQLRKLCEERAVTWTEVDLRWGITTEQAAEGKVLPLCLEEIYRCRPYFIGLLGERYGWVPEPNSIPAELLESQAWLKQHLQHSVTELEILHGVFSKDPVHGYAYFYFRNPKYLETVPTDKRQDFTAESTEAARKLRKLKQKIRGARDEHVCELRENYANPEQLGEWVLEDFTKLIDRLYPKDQTPDPLDQETARHEAYARNRRLAFVGREDFLRRLNERSAVPGKPFVLTGNSGCGKSALLAEWVTRWRKDHPDDLIIQHYIGSTQDSADWQGLVRRISGELKSAFAIPDDLPLQPNALRSALNDWTVKAASSRRVVLVLDALNQLADDGAARQLGWLPFVFPTNFRVLVSSLPGESLDVLRKRGWPELTVPLFSQTDIAPAALAYFKIFGKTLPPDILAKLESTPAACNALYLRTVLDELHQFGKHEELKAKANDYLSAPDLPELFDRILIRWHDDFGRDPDHPDLVGRSLCLIACARFGLSESELLDLLGKKITQGKDEPLPRRPWTPFYLAAENALALRAGLLNFGHDYLRAAVQKRWLGNAEAVRAFRLQLVEYFGKIVEPSVRKLAEFPWQMAKSEEWQSLFAFLAHLQSFQAICCFNWLDVQVYWMELERNSRHRPWDAYATVLQDPASDPNSAWFVALLLTHLWHGDLAIALWQFLAGHFKQTGESINRARVLLNAAECFRRHGKLTEATQLLQDVSGFFRAKRDWRDLATALLNLAIIQSDHRELVEALTLFRKVERLSRHIQDNTLLAGSYGGQARVQLWQGNYTQARSLLKAEETLYAELGDPLRLSRCWLAQAVLLRMSGFLVDALELQKKAEDTCREIGDKQGEATAVGDRAMTLEFHGEWDEALRLLHLQKWIYENIGDQAGLARSLGNQAKIMISLIQRDGKHRAIDAIKLLREQERIARCLNDPTALLASLQNQAVALRNLGEFDMALGILSEKEQLSRRFDDQPALASCLQEKANIILRNQSPASLAPAKGLLEEKVLICRRLGLMRELATGLGTLAHVYRLHGMYTRAVELYREAVSLLKNVGDVVGMATSLYNIGTLFRDELNQPDKAKQYLGESFALAKKYRLTELLRRLQVESKGEVESCL